MPDVSNDLLPTPHTIFEARDLTVVAGTRTLLQGVSLALRPGEIVALHGPSGCGKTTLLRALCGLEDCAAGEVLLGGQSPHEWNHFRRRVILVEQRPVMFECSVEANLRRPFAYRASEGSFSSESAHELMTRLGLHDVVFGFSARRLSQGQQQRLALVRALLLSPRVLLLDEPTSALDAASSGEVEELLCEEARRGLAMLMITHDAVQAARCCQRTIDVTQWMPHTGDAPA